MENIMSQREMDRYKKNKSYLVRTSRDHRYESGNGINLATEW